MVGSERLRWSVDRDGYACVTASHFDARPSKLIPSACQFLSLVGSRDPSERYIVPKHLLSDSHIGSRQYDPMTKLGLFRRLARLDQKPEVVTAFANEYGILLGVHSYEPLHDWHTAIRQLDRAVRLYDLAIARQTPEAKQQIVALLPWLVPRGEPSTEELLSQLEGERKHTAPPPDRYTPFTGVWDAPGWSVGKYWRDRFRGDCVAAAMWAVREVITIELRNQASITLFAQDYFAPVTTGLGFIPHSLLGALWLQFALQVAEMRKRAACQNCGRFFWLKVGGAPDTRAQRKDTKYCRRACKVAAWRKRQKAARHDPQAAG